MLLNFDYDGVIVDSLDDLVEKTQQAQRILGLGRPPERRDFQTIENLTFFDLAVHIGIPKDKVDDFGTAFFEVQKNDTGLTPVFEGMTEVFSTLTEKHTVTIITSSTAKTVERVLKHNGLLDGVSLILDGQMEGSKSKKITYVRNKYYVSAEETFMIGDSMSDIRQGKTAGVKTVAVTWGYQSAELLGAESPDHTVTTPDELFELFS